MGPRKALLKNVIRNNKKLIKQKNSSKNYEKNIFNIFHCIDYIFPKGFEKLFNLDKILWPTIIGIILK